MAIDWNSFNRELEQRVEDPRLRYMLGLIYERMMEMAQIVDAQTDLMVSLAEKMEMIVELVGLEKDTNLKEALEKAAKGGMDGVSLQSESITDDPDDDTRH